MGKRWLITGTTRGIGLELTKLVLQAGHEIIAVGRKPDQSTALRELMTSFPKQLQLKSCDVCREQDVHHLVEFLGDSAVDILVNNAGIFLESDRNLKTLDWADFARTWETNTMAPLRLTRALLPNLHESDFPKVINISSQMGSISDRISGGHYSYRMSKAALNMFTRTLAVDEPRLTVISIHPGWVQTEMGGPQATLPVHRSASGILKQIETLSKEQTGTFVGHDGKVIPW